FTRASNVLYFGGPHNLSKLVLRQHVSKLLQEPGLTHLNEFPHGHSVSNTTGSVDHCVYRVHYILHIKTRGVGISCVLKPLPTNALSGASPGRCRLSMNSSLSPPLTSASTRYSPPS